MIEWKVLPKEPWEELEEETFLIFLPKSGRAITAVHDAVNRWFVTPGEDEEHIYFYRYISHYAEMDWPDIDDGPMIDECEHGKVLVCEECAKRHRSDRTAQPKAVAVEDFGFNIDSEIDKMFKKER